MIFYCLELDTLLLLTISVLKWERETMNQGISLAFQWEYHGDFSGILSFDSLSNYTLISMGAM